ncbi:MAG: hypothetical protein KAI53_05095 [Candidatus Aenigmarchaeota archaeon]|nr:hypothetical protein [Candidatus Aenigmarchaeota archaeon]
MAYVTTDIDRFIDKYLIDFILILIGFGLLYPDNIIKKIPWLFAIFSIIFIYLGIRNIYGKINTHYIKKNIYKTNNYRSKKEKDIADWLKRRKILFVYEKKLKMGDITLRPDFFLPEYGIYVEYWGMMDNPEYKEERRKRIKLYKEHQIPLLELYPDKNNKLNLDWQFFNKLLELLKKVKT